MLSKIHYRLVAWAIFGSLASMQAQPLPDSKTLFGEKFPSLDNAATGAWWKNTQPNNARRRILDLNVPRDQVVAFALYTVQRGTLKMTAQLYPLMPEESQWVRLEVKQGEEWKEIARSPVVYPGWSAHFKITGWDTSRSIPYRVLHGEKASFEGVVRRDPVDKNVIVVGNLSCNSSRTTGPRPQIVENLIHQDPDLLFFSGDQTYHHTQHTAGWLEFGLQFRDVMKDRPTITIPDDHDVGQANLWGEYGIEAATPAGPRGGYFYPPAYVNMVQRCQTWHLPDAHDSRPIERGITVYYTALNVGGVDFAILEDRKFKSGPEGKIPKMGPRPDHINDPAYDRKSVDLAGLKLLGDRQLNFLNDWGQDWTGAQMKAVLSQTAFCGAVHLHGSPDNRLLADLDCNGWPQTGRNKALEAIRRVWAPHLCGDQHLAVVVQHGIQSPGDGPYGFTSPAIINTIYGRWWEPEDHQPGAHPVPNSPLPWTGDFLDGLGNPIRMIAYANPEDRNDEKKRADGYGLARFDKKDRTITFECWPRFASVKQGDKQFAGWPVTIRMEANDGRTPKGWLPEMTFEGVRNPVVQVVDEASGEILYTVRVQGNRFQPAVYAPGKYTVRWGQDKPDQETLSGLEAKARDQAGAQKVQK